jgi:hypothetical protein
MKLRGSGDRSCSVLCLADHVEILRLEQGARRSPETGMVVDDQHRPAHERTVAEVGAPRIGALPEPLRVRAVGSDPVPGYHHLVADQDGKPLDERLEEIGAQLAWVRDYL